MNHKQVIHHPSTHLQHNCCDSENVFQTQQVQTIHFSVEDQNNPYKSERGPRLPDKTFDNFSLFLLNSQT